MGVDYKHYVVLGVDVSKKRKEIESDEKYLPYIDGDIEVDFRIVDGREGYKFLWFGKILADGDKYEFIKPQTIDLETLEPLRKQIMESYQKVFEETCELKDVKLFAGTSIY